MDAQKIIVNVQVPAGWAELSQKELRYLYKLLTKTALPAKTMQAHLLLRWGGVRLLHRWGKSEYMIKAQGRTFAVSPDEFATALTHLEWIKTPPSEPVRLERAGRGRAVDAEFRGVPFETFIVCDNLYQGVVHRPDMADALLRDMAVQMYPGIRRYQVTDVVRTNVLYWYTSLKTLLARSFSDFLQRAEVGQGGRQGVTQDDLRRSVDAQIRCLTKGDVTKIDAVMQIDTWHALAELDAQAREYKELKKTMDKK